MRRVAAMLRSVRAVASRAMSRGVTPARFGVSAFIGITTLIIMQSMGWGQTPPARLLYRVCLRSVDNTAPSM
jgi:hypothetical protein